MTEPRRNATTKPKEATYLITGNFLFFLMLSVPLLAAHGPVIIYGATEPRCPWIVASQDHRTNPNHSIGYAYTTNRTGRVDAVRDNLADLYFHDVYEQTGLQDRVALDIGCGSVGTSIKTAIMGGVSQVVALDKETSHLFSLYAELEDTEAKKVQLMHGEFPFCLPKLASVIHPDFIYAGRVFHFNRTQDVRWGLMTLLSMARPEARLYISVASPYASVIHPNYRKVGLDRRGNFNVWKGLLYTPRYLRRYENYPEWVQLYTPNTLWQLVRSVRWRGYRWMTEWVNYYPDPLLRDNPRDRVGLVAVKRRY